ncbi:MAG: polysaccharide pyruvyl transferase CsaB [Ruminococcaceae bacterium]|nr:polysaccharide pyruvyl transferase CsaB [Oscillospiraceae bacterium]
MKIIHMISGGDVGGAKTHVLSLLAGLNRTQTVHLVCFTEGDFAKEARQLGIPTTVIAGNNLSTTKKRILAMIRHDGYQVMHCHGARANMMGHLLRKKAKIPVISTIHSDYKLDYMGRPLANLTYGNINRRVLPKFDAWVGVSDGMRRLLTERGFDPQRIYTLYNGVDFSTERRVRPRSEVLSEMGFAETDVVFGIAARINPVKDMTTLVKAFAKAQKECPFIRLAIAGEGEEEAQIKALAKELCAENTVHFAGWVKDIDSFYHALDVNCLTSLSETFPYALTEGARMKCATISSEVGGVPYLIDDGSNGLLFKPQDVDALAAHIVRLAGDAALRKRMGQALYEKTKQDFSLEAMIAKQIKIYETILRRAARPKNCRDGVVICGAYGKGNSGDNAILNAIVDQLHHIDPDVPITVLSRDPTETRLCANVDSVYTFSLRKIGKRMRHAKLYISGGGTLMQDATSTRSLLYYLYSIRQAARKGCRVMLYGCGVGPIDKEKNRKRASKTLNRYAEVISVRDRYSEEFLKELRVSKPRICLTADPALLIDPPETDELSNYLRRCGIERDKRYLMLAVRPWEGFEKKVEAIAQAVDTACEKNNLIPVLYCMEPNRDDAAAKMVAKHLRSAHLLLHTGTNGEEILALVRRMSFVVSMRLHTLIFAAGQSVPMVGIVYDPKVSGFLDYLGKKHYVPLEDVTQEKLLSLIEAAMNDTQSESIHRLRELASENEVLAAELLQ